MVWKNYVVDLPPVFSTRATVFYTLLFHGLCIVLLPFLCFLYLCRVKESMRLMKIHMAIHKNMKSNIRINNNTRINNKGGAAAALAAAAPPFLLMWRPLGRHRCCCVDANVAFHIFMYCHVDFHQSHAFFDTAKVQKTEKGKQNKTRSMKQQGG